MTKKKYLHKHFFGFLIVFLVLQACEDKKEISSIDPISWESRQIAIPENDSLASGETYLSIYSEIYSQTEHITHDLTATISMRNTSREDTIYVERADYYAKWKAHPNLF